jgi:hypothetical protein
MSLTVLVIGVSVCLAVGVSARHLSHDGTPPALLELVGAVLLLVVVLTHVAEQLHLLPGIGWGPPDSAGHYIDLVSTIGGPIMFPVGPPVGRPGQCCQSALHGPPAEMLIRLIDAPRA